MDLTNNKNDVTNTETNSALRYSSKLLQKGKRQKPSKPTEVNYRKLKILVTVVNRNKTEFYMDFLQGFEVNFQTSVLAQGTAKSEMLYMLGLEESDKSVIFSVLREDKAAEAMQMLDEIGRASCRERVL